MVTVAGTGHRKDKIEIPAWVMTKIKEALAELDATHVITGMASGFDLWLGDIAGDLKIPYTAAKPWMGHKATKGDEVLYKKVLDHAKFIHSVVGVDRFPGNQCYQRRNEWMVDRAQVVLACWDGSNGGTANAVHYAMRTHTPIYRINPVTLEVGWFRKYGAT